MPELPTTVPIEVLARILDLSDRRIPQLVAEGIIPKTDRGRYPLIPCVQGYIRYLRAGSKGQNLGSEALAVNHAKLTSARAEIEELKRAKMAGEMVPRDQIARAWSEVCMTVRSHLLGIPARLAARIGMAKNAVEVQQILRRDIEESLSELAKVNVEIEAGPAPKTSTRHRSESGDDGHDDAADVRAAAESDDQRMGRQ